VALAALASPTATHLQSFGLKDKDIGRMLVADCWIKERTVGYDFRAVSLFFAVALAAIQVALCSGCESVPRAAAAPYPSAVIADLDRGVYEIWFESAECPASVPVRTRWRGEMKEALWLPREAAGYEKLVLKGPSETSGSARVIVPLGVMWEKGDWRIYKQDCPIRTIEFREAEKTGIRVRLPVRRPGVENLTPLKFPGVGLKA